VSSFNCIIMGAAGRDFHDFQTFFRSHPQFRVCCFTAEQIPFIDKRSFPRELCGDGYDADIPIHLEAELEALIERYEVDFVFLSYSDLAHEDVMHKASRVQAAGASFCLLGPKHNQLRSSRPVLSVTAVRTGCGKSPISQAVAQHLRERGKRVGIVRHPMPYGDLTQQRVQRFAEPADLDRHKCTVEEREEYQPYLELGLTIYAGVDYAAILAAAEQDNDVVLWDGGNNDLPFYQSGLRIVVVDALRAGHEMRYYPGESNLRSADVVVISKVDDAKAEDLALVRANVARYAPKAKVIEAGLQIVVDDPSSIEGKRVLVIEDGPTTTHGGMPSGAGMVAAQRYGAAEIIDARLHAVGSVARAYVTYPQLDRVLPALGYSDEQREELTTTVRAAAPEVVLDGSPARIGRALDLDIPVVPVHYRFVQRSGPSLLELIDAYLA
jgi:predicted GTPase